MVSAGLDDGRSLTYALTSKGVTNIWSYPLDGGQAKQLTDFKNDQIFNFRWSPDGKSLVFCALVPSCRI